MAVLRVLNNINLRKITESTISKVVTIKSQKNIISFHKKKSDIGITPSVRIGGQQLPNTGPKQSQDVRVNASKYFATCKAFDGLKEIKF